jgi:hypothetical protein
MKLMMSAKLSPSPYQPSIRGRPRTFAVATAVAPVICSGLGVSTSRADVGTVYVDAKNNAAAGGANWFFNGPFIGTNNVGLGRGVLRDLTTGGSNVATGTQALSSSTTGDFNVASVRMR